MNTHSLIFYCQETPSPEHTPMRVDFPNGFGFTFTYVRFEVVEADVEEALLTAKPRGGEIILNSAPCPW